MYLGMLIALAGIALLLGSVSPWAVPPALAWILGDRVILVEEEMLEKQFGEAYRNHASRVRRWI